MNPLWSVDALKTYFQEYGASFPTPNRVATQIYGISIDTRTLQKGDLFIALKGDNQDGHLYVSEAVARGAAAILTETFVKDLDVFQIIVPDTFDALWYLARLARQRTRACVLAVTGSVGKTSTKEMLFHTLSAFGKTFCSPASYNNHWGVPLSLARMPPDAAYAIFEVGMNHPGETAPLARLIRPDIAIITAIAPAHIGHMKTMDAIAQEKAQLFQGLPSSGIAVIPASSPYRELLTQQAAAMTEKPPLFFGEDETSDVRLLEYEQRADRPARVTVRVAHKVHTYHLPVFGKHQALNSLIPLTVSVALHLDPNPMLKKLEEMPSIKNRGQIHHLNIDGQKIILIDDAYNANLSSVTAALTTLQQLAGLHRRTIFVFGEMLELGEYAQEHHMKVAQLLKEQKVGKVFCTGNHQWIQNCFEELNPDQRGAIAERPQDLLSEIRSCLQSGDILLVKGSQGSRVHTIVGALCAWSL